MKDIVPSLRNLALRVISGTRDRSEYNDIFDSPSASREIDDSSKDDKYQTEPSEIEQNITELNQESTIDVNNNLGVEIEVEDDIGDLNAISSRFNIKLREIHEEHEEKASELSHQLEEAGQKLEQANLNIEFLLKSKQNDRAILLDAINGQLEKAKVDLECANNYIACIESTEVQNKEQCEEHVKVMLAEHEDVLHSLVQKFEEINTDLKYLEQLKKEQDNIIEELKRDKDNLRHKLQEFEKRNSKAFSNLQLLIYEKECLVKKLTEKESSLENLQRKYRSVLDANSSLKIDLEDTKTYLGVVMQKELERCDADLLVMMMNYVAKMCHIQNKLNETETEIEVIRAKESTGKKEL